MSNMRLSRNMVIMTLTLIKMMFNPLIYAILVKESQKDMLELEIELLKQKCFHNVEISSADISRNPNRMIQLLHDLKELPFRVYAYVIDKRKIREDSGITFKSTFFNYVNRMVYDDLNRTFEQLDLVAADDGMNEYMQEFKKYINSTSIPDLFHYSLFGFNQINQIFSFNWLSLLQR